MSNLVKKEIRTFYLEKYFNGRIFTASEFKSLCSKYKVWLCSEQHEVEVKENIITEDGYILGYRIIKERTIKIRQRFLVRKDDFFKTEMNKRCGYLKLPGLDLCIVPENEKISWWQIDKYGTDKSLILTNIPEECISKRVKNYNEIVYYLRMWKSMVLPEQQRLPNF